MIVFRPSLISLVRRSPAHARRKQPHAISCLAVHLFLSPFCQKAAGMSKQKCFRVSLIGLVSCCAKDDEGFGRGDLVVAEGHITCGHCRNCLAGRRHLCPNAQGVGVNRPGGWAEFVAIRQENCWHADPSIPLDVLSCFDPLHNAVHTALSFDLVGEDVLITGAGPIGCMAIPFALAYRFRFARGYGNRRVIVKTNTRHRIHGRNLRWNAHSLHYRCRPDKRKAATS